VLPVNTNGAGLSCAHPGMYNLLAIIEAVRQARGAAASQIDGATLALATAMVARCRARR
jgi:hypothetical protein